MVDFAAWRRWLDFAALRRWVVALIALGAISLSLPNIMPQSWLDILPHWVASLPIEFTIDLRGGSRLVVQLDPSDVNLDANGAAIIADAAIIETAMAVMRRRLDAMGEEFAHHHITSQQQGQIRVEVPALFDVSLLKNFVTLTARLAIYLPYPNVNADDVIAAKIALPDDALIFYDHGSDPPIAYLVGTSPLLVSENIEAAMVRPIGYQDHAELDLVLRKDVNFSPHSSIERDSKIAHSALIVVMDGEVIGHARPNVQAGITMGDLGVDFAENLAIIINSGPLPTSAHLLEERTIGAEMGADFALAGLKAAGGALVVVALFMMICYGILGFIANLALLVNLALLASILGMAGLPLSLAGFAGLVLTIGVSVDALILIYERMREEAMSGAKLEKALDAGFSRARNTILDANATTLLGAIMLFLFGLGPISGFAMTVTIGICASLFTNLVLARELLEFWLRHFKPADMPMRWFRVVPAHTAIAFMRLHKFCLFLAAMITAVTLALFSTAGLNYGIDFVGGSVAILTPYEGEANLTDITERALDLNMGAVRAEKEEGGNSVYLTIPSQQMGEEADQSVALKLRGEFDAEYQLERVDVVGPTIAERASRVSLWAIFLSLIAIFLYVWARFNWKFALGAFITTLHDIAVFLLIFTLTQWEFNLWSIAALLAIIGYSLNDTIVVYDRIRSFLTHGREVSMAGLVELGINRTLSRTILTSLATLLAHIPLYYYGGADMRNFASVLLIGIIVGTASSIFIAGPLLAIFGLGSKRGI